jgi:long-chain acyl-CoA synthetase
LTDLAKSIGISGTYSDLCKNPQLLIAATEFISDFGKKRKLGKFEIPTKIALCEDSWTPESNLVTAAFKIKRKEVVKKYEDVIKRIYV